MVLLHLATLHLAAQLGCLVLKSILGVLRLGGAGGGWGGGWVLAPLGPL